MKRYQQKAIKLAADILKDLNKPVYRMCPICLMPTDAIDYGDGDKYGHVYHSSCYQNKGKIKGRVK